MLFTAPGAYAEQVKTYIDNRGVKYTLTLSDKGKQKSCNCERKDYCIDDIGAKMEYQRRTADMTFCSCLLPQEVRDKVENLYK